MSNSKKMKKHLTDAINYTSSNIKEFLVNPDCDFTRNRKLNLNTIFRLILTFEAGALKDELYNYFGICESIPTASALIQQRNKIKSDAFKLLFDQFNKMTHKEHIYKGYKLLAVDGTVAPISYDPHDKLTLTDCASSHKGFNALHINAFYQFVDNYNGPKSIFIADRGYESFNGFEHVIRSGNKYLIRIKDINSNGIAKNIGVDGEFDMIFIVSCQRDKQKN